MKRLIISTLIILLLVGLAGAHVSHLKNITGELIGLLETSQQGLEQKNWSAAAESMAQVTAQWERHAFFLHTTLRHADIDDIRASMKEITAYLESREDRSECLAVTAKLINQLELLLEAELPTIQNLL